MIKKITNIKLHVLVEFITSQKISIRSFIGTTKHLVI